MGWNWRSRLLGTVGVAALVVGAGLVAAAPAGAAPVADANTLRAAVSDANGSGPTTQIELVPGTTYSLPGGAGCTDEDGNAAGDLDIRRTNPLKIFTPDGQPPAVLQMTCDSVSSPQRVIDVLRPATGAVPGKLTLRNVVIRNGHAPNGAGGGGVRSAGDVIVENAVFESNIAGRGEETARGSRAGGSGGAVAAEGAVTITASSFAGNQAGNGGNGVSQGQELCTGAAGGEGGFGGQGGAVLAIGGLTITDSTFAANRAGNGGNGGNGSCGGNDVKPGGAGGAGGMGGYGGAVQCGVITDRDAKGCTGQAAVRGSTFNGNASGTGGTGGNGGIGAAGGAGGAGGDGGGSGENAFGGAILFIGLATATTPTTLLVENSTLDGNSSGAGGTGGTGGVGGAGANGGDAGDGGHGGAGGAVVAGFGDDDGGKNVTTLVHVTATDNGAGGAGGAPGKPGGAGAAAAANGVAAAAAAGADGDPGDTRGGSVAFFDSWTSTATVIGTSDPAGDGPDCWTKAANHNLSRSTDADTDENGCGFGAGSVGTLADYALMPLADNGGPTQTRLLAPTSSLVDKVTGLDGLPTVDQRGVARPQAAGADIGAVEIQLIDPKVTKTASASSVASGSEVTFTITVANNGTSSPKPGVTIADPKCPNVSTPTGDANTNNTLDPGETYTYTCKLKLTEAGKFTNSVTATVTDGAGVPISRTASVDVTVTGGGAAGGGGTPPLAKTGANNPTPELMLGAWLIAGGLVLVLISRRRRARVRVPLSDQ